MRYLLVIILAVSTLFISCKNQGKQIPSYTFRDSVVNEYWQGQDAVSRLDTADMNYKVLKAYYNNDSNFFRKLRVDLEEAKKYGSYRDSMEICIHQSKLQDIYADEAYRFKYSSGWCLYRLNAIVTRKNDSANLHFIIYTATRDSIPCGIVNEYDKKLSSRDWSDFSRALSDADFWGLNGTNENIGLNGGQLTATGFVKADTNFNKPAKFKSVYRYGRSTLDNPLALLIKLSGNKQVCY